LIAPLELVATVTKTLHSITVTPANPSIAAGATQQFTATSSLDLHDRQRRYNSLAVNQTSFGSDLRHAINAFNAVILTKKD
jgi:hypothetical protein